LVFTIPIPKEILVSTFRYHFFGGNPFFPQKGGNGPLFEEKGGTSPLFDTASPPFAEKRSSRQISTGGSLNLDKDDRKKGSCASFHKVKEEVVVNEQVTGIGSCISQQSPYTVWFFGPKQGWCSTSTL
jgi:hypothetical protein